MHVGEEVLTSAERNGDRASAEGGGTFKMLRGDSVSKRSCRRDSVWVIVCGAGGGGRGCRFSREDVDACEMVSKNEGRGM